MIPEFGLEEKLVLDTPPEEWAFDDAAKCLVRGSVRLGLFDKVRVVIQVVLVEGGARKQAIVVKMAAAMATSTTSGAPAATGKSEPAKDQQPAKKRKVATDASA
jgi:hypothetical protein